MNGGIVSFRRFPRIDLRLSCFQSVNQEQAPGDKSGRNGATRRELSQQGQRSPARRAPQDDATLLRLALTTHLLGSSCFFATCCHHLLDLVRGRLTTPDAEVSAFEKRDHSRQSSISQRDLDAKPYEYQKTVSPDRPTSTMTSKPRIVNGTQLAIGLPPTRRAAQ